MPFRKPPSLGETHWLKLADIVGEQMDLTLLSRRESELTDQATGKKRKTMTYICRNNETGMQVGLPGFGALDKYWLKGKPEGTRFLFTYHGKQLVLEGKQAGNECHQCEYEEWYDDDTAAALPPPVQDQSEIDAIFASEDEIPFA